MPTDMPQPWPSGPVVASTPVVDVMFRMTGTAAVKLAERLDVVQRHRELVDNFMRGVDRFYAREMQRRIKQHRGVSVGQYETVAIEPDRVFRIVADENCATACRLPAPRHRRSDVPTPLRSGRPDLAQSRPFHIVQRHASMLLYATLHLAGVKAVNAAHKIIDQLAVSLTTSRRSASLDSRCPGHPEHHITTGVEATTGPLGQGCGHVRRHGDGRALGWRQTFNRPTSKSSITTFTSSAATAT